MIPKTVAPSEDFKRWFIKCRFRNGFEECYSLSTQEKDRLEKNLPYCCEQKGIEFFEFNSNNHRILIQASQLTFFQFLFEPQLIDQLHNLGEENSENDDEEENRDNYAVKIYFVNDSTPMIFHVDEDQENPEDEGDQGEMNNFIYFALNIHDEGQMLHFTDEDGETAYFRGSDIAVAEIPLKVVNEDCG